MLCRKSQLNLAQILPQPPTKQQSFLKPVTTTTTTVTSNDQQQVQESQQQRPPSQKVPSKKEPPKKPLPPKPQPATSGSRIFKSLPSIPQHATQKRVSVVGDPVLEKMLSNKRLPSLPSPKRIPSTVLHHLSFIFPVINYFWLPFSHDTFRSLH